MRYVLPFSTRVARNCITFHVLLKKMVMKTSKFTSAACAKVVRDQTRSTTPCVFVRSKLLCAKRCVADSTRKQRVSDLYKSSWKSWRLTNHSARIVLPVLQNGFWLANYRVGKVWAASIFFYINSSKMHYTFR